jgi:hypothetical protein
MPILPIRRLLILKGFFGVSAEIPVPIAADCAVFSIILLKSSS